VSPRGHTGRPRARAAMSRLRRLAPGAGALAEQPLPRPDTTDVTVTFPWARRQPVETRSHYLWGTLLAARLGRGLGLPRISVLELGVAGGNGLLALERAAALASDLIGIAVDVHGFDAATGMPAPVDNRDLPWLIEPGWFAMDEAALRRRLTSAQLVLGSVAETIPAFLAAAPAPIGFVAFDLDYYSATRDAFALLSAEAGRLLPRVVCYFDDVIGYGWSDFTGERAAIDEFNAATDERKLGRVHGLRYTLPASEHGLPWHEQIWLLHAFDHPHYRSPEGPLADGWLAAHRLVP
jgi:hypothetical protein